MEAATEFVVESPDVVYSPEAIEAHYEYRTTCVSREGGVLKVSEGPTGRAMGLGEPGSREGAGIAQRLRLPPCSEAGEACGPAAHRAARPQVHPTSTRFTFRTARQVPRLGVMLVGWGGNNGSTLTAAGLANRLRLSWPTRTGRKVGGRARLGRREGFAGIHAEGEGLYGGVGPQWAGFLAAGGLRGGASAGGRELLRGLAGAEPKVWEGFGVGPPERSGFRPGLERRGEIGRAHV